MSGAPPQVIRQSGESWTLLNVDLEPLSNVQRVALAAQIWPQVRYLMEVSGEFKERDPKQIGTKGIGSFDDIDRVAAGLVRAKFSAVNRTRGPLRGNGSIMQRALDNDFDTFNDLQRALGLKIRSTISEGKKSKSKYPDAFFGHGDKFDNALTPILHYLKPWEKRDFLFTHVNPKEAARRIRKIDEVMQGLAKTREDLEKRSHAARLSAPSEKKRREN